MACYYDIAPHVYESASSQRVVSLVHRSPKHLYSDVTTISSCQILILYPLEMLFLTPGKSYKMILCYDEIMIDSIIISAID